MSTVPQTVSDLPYTKTVTLDGETIGGVQSVNIDYDINNTTTLVTLKLIVAREGISINGQNISIRSAKRSNLPQKTITDPGE